MFRVVQPSSSGHTLPLIASIFASVAAAFAPDIEFGIGDDAAVGYAERGLCGFSGGNIALPQKFGQI